MNNPGRDDSSHNMPHVSVIIPAYNSSKSVGETLHSVFAQTFRDYEVIVINDGSPDTEELEQALEVYQNKFIYLKQQNSGAAAARNTGLRIAKGEFVAFLDSDDRWLPTYLEEQIEFLKESRSDVAYCDALLVGDPKSAGRTYMELAPSRCPVTPESLLAVDVGVITSGVVVKRKLVYDVGLFDEDIKRGHDFDLWLRLAQKGAIFACHRKVLVHYTVLGQGLSGDSISQLERRLELLSRIHARRGLSSLEETALLRNQQECTARLLLEKGKAELLKKNFTGAREYFNRSKHVRSSWKLGAVNLVLSVAPTLVRLFVRVRESDCSVISSYFRGQRHESS